MSSCTKIDPLELGSSMSILTAVGAEKYIDIFKKHNIGQPTLAELSDEDLIKLGVDDEEIRKKLLKDVKSIPIYEKQPKDRIKSSLGPIDIIDIFNNSSDHLQKIYMSLTGNICVLKKKEKLTDCLLHKDKYASNIALNTLSEITNILNSMDIAMHTQMKGLKQDGKKTKTKKIIVGTVGSAAIAFLAVLFVRSLRQLK